MILSPSLAGSVPIRSSGPAFVQAFARRLDQGLLPGGSPRRMRYAVTEAGAVTLGFRAVDWLTAIGVGLNEVELRATEAGVLHYRVRFRRWAAWVLGLSALIGCALTVTFLALDLPAYVLRTPSARLPGLTVGQNVGVAWGMAIFGGFVWPWILIAMHRRSLRRLMERLIGEVDGAAAAAAAGAATTAG
jgi:hypothetical protein